MTTSHASELSSRVEGNDHRCGNLRVEPRGVLAGATGITPEWHNPAVCGYFVSMHQVLFFPSGDPLAPIL
jgi:hypothetical protein